MATTVRLFLAINLPAPERRAIRDATSRLRDAARPVSWVTEDRLHLTLKFLGEQPEQVIGPLREALLEVAARTPVSRLELAGLGAFPNLRDPRVVWLGVGRDPKLELLHHDIETACAALGHEVDGRAFRPHVTLGRVRSRLSGEASRALSDAARRVEYSGTVDATSFEVMESRLTPSGPNYSVVATIPLRGT
jgi:RNA 2',3'-cyclic 3'-phosphodiesterase